MTPLRPTAPFARATLLLTLLASAQLPAAETPPAVALTLEPTLGAAATLTLGRTKVPLQAGGGFHVFDATAKREVALEPGALSGPPDARQFTAQGGGLRLRATFRAAGDRIEVEGEIENEAGGERGLIVSYRIPAWNPAARFASELDLDRPLDGKYEENAYPIATMSDATAGVALAIPPMRPCVFGLTGEASGLALRFYLGVSPKPRRFPNRAPFAFTVYAVEPAEAFRSALARYYALHPDYYTPRLQRDGLWMFQMGDRMPANIDQYGFDEIEMQSPVLAAAMDRNTKHGIPTFPYTIVGQREIKRLPALPKNYAEALAVLQAWKPATRELSKEDVSAEMAARLKDEIESSACTTADGRYALVVRNTVWGGDSVTFKINPNPDLFAGEGRYTVGADTLATIDGWLRQYPHLAGIYVDSLGANWPATFNYRPDHFTYARHPLTVDAAGRVTLHNDLSHYEFLETLRARLRQENRLLFGNGIYAYKSRGEAARKVELQTFDNQLNEFTSGAGAPPEHYRPGARLGRFFDAALLDLAGSEAGVNATISRCQDVRVFMGRKHYAFLNYHWEDPAKVSEYFNKALAYAIFATCSRNFMTGVEYENHPNGYLRDKELIDWFVPLARLLSRAGWEPVRHATIAGGPVVCERFGAGGTVYFAVFNDQKTDQACMLQLDLARLGFRPDAAQVTEVARQARIEQAGSRVSVTVPSKKTLILKVTAR